MKYHAVVWLLAIKDESFVSLLEYLLDVFLLLFTD